MAESANNKLLDQSVRHQIGILRYAGGLTKDLTDLLDKAEEEVQRKLQQAAKGRWTSRRLERLLTSIRDISKEAHVAMGQEARGQLRDLSKQEAEWASERIGGVTPQIDIVTPDAATLNQLVTNDPFRGKLMKEWTSELSNAMYRDARDAVRLGVLEGESIPDISRRLQGVMKTSKHRASTWARTAVNHVANSAREATYQQNTRVVKGIQWLSTLDTRTSPICRTRDGEIYEPGKGPRPPAHPNCRSTTVPVLKSWQEMGIDADELPESTRASMDGQVPARKNYNDWLRSQVQNSRMDVVRDALGPKRAKLFAAGGLKIDRFTDQAGNLLTLQQLKKREAALFKRLDIL